MFDFKITNDNGAIDFICCKNRTQAIETYCLIYGYSKEYVKKHCVIRKVFDGRTGEWRKKKGGASDGKE